MSQPITLIRGRGRPRTRPGETKLTTIRVEPYVSKGLRAEFGSISNALYYLYEAITEFREARGLEVDPSTPDFETYQLGPDEIRILAGALECWIDRSKLTPPIKDGRALRPYRGLLNKLNRAITPKPKPKERLEDYADEPAGEEGPL